VGADGVTTIYVDGPDKSEIILQSGQTLDGSPLSGPLLSIEGKKGKSGSIELVSDTEGRPHLVLSDAGGYPRIHLAVEANGYPRIFVHRLHSSTLFIHNGTYVTPVWHEVGWFRRRTDSYVWKSIARIEAAAARALAELGETAEAVAANLTRVGALPSSLLHAWGVIAQYLCRTKKLAQEGLGGSDRITLWKRHWFLGWLQVVVQFPPAVRAFCEQWDKARWGEIDRARPGN
jgi:hypothetical protein